MSWLIVALLPALASPPDASGPELAAPLDAADAGEPAVEGPHEEAVLAELPAWASAGSGLFRQGEQRVLRGVAVATGQRFLMDARKDARPRAVDELERQVRRLFSALTVAYGKTATSSSDGAVVGEIAGLADAYVAYQHRLLDEIDAEHTAWSGRPDDAYWAVAELELAAVRSWIEDHAEVGPWTRTWLLEHVQPVFDASATAL